ncbi:MAG: hypothetical protein PHI12_07420 [Dehalococcoidales bacterium]|nr:hypothetical protein [Dehalococcoidales bacterium]
MNIDQLIDELKKYPGKSQVLVTWEGTEHELETDMVYQVTSGVVMLDADGNFYKEDYISEGRVRDPLEGY